MLRSEGNISHTGECRILIGRSELCWQTWHEASSIFFRHALVESVDERVAREELRYEVTLRRTIFLKDKLGVIVEILLSIKSIAKSLYLKISYANLSSIIRLYTPWGPLPVETRVTAPPPKF